MNQVDLTRALKNKKMERVRSGNKKTHFIALTWQEPHFRDEDKTLVNRTYLFLSKPYWEAELELSSRTFVFVNYAAISNEVCSTDRLNQSRLTETKRQRFMGSCTKPRAKDPSVCSSSLNAFGYVIESLF